eukprot:gene8983-9156_t
MAFKQLNSSDLDVVWFVSAMALLNIHRCASSPAMAEELSGGSAIPVKYLEPIGCFVEAKQAALVDFGRTVCQSNWHISPAVTSSGFVALLLNLQPAGRTKTFSVLWARALLGAAGAAQGAIVWQAAVSAATDQQLSRQPCFGGRRPDEPWLAAEMRRLANSPALDTSNVIGLIQTAYDAAIKLLDASSTRQGKPGLESLLLDLALVAAVETSDWEEAFVFC